jgi:hypothetical protein
MNRWVMITMVCFLEWLNESENHDNRCSCRYITGHGAFATTARVALAALTLSAMTAAMFPAVDF